MKNLSSQKNHEQIIDAKFPRNFYEESLESKDKFFLNDSEVIENYNNVLKSPQSRRLYKDLENEIHPNSLKVQNILPLHKISI